MAERKSQVDQDVETAGSSVSDWPSMSTEEERSLAKQAMNEFKTKNYTACLTTLSTLAKTRCNDHKLAVNRAVAEYFKSGLTRTNEFRQALNEIGVKVNSDDTYEVDLTLLNYNQAVIHFYTKQYQTAINIVDKFVPTVVEMCRISYPSPQSCLATSSFPFESLYFMCEVCLSALQPGKALALMNQIESDVSALDMKPGGSERDDGSQREDQGHGRGQEKRDAWKAILGQYRMRCYLMLKMVKQAKNMMKVLSNLAGTTTSVLFLKSQSELGRCNYLKAARVLSSSPELLSSKPNRTPLGLMYYNNMAVIHFNMRKPNMALHYLRGAVDQNATHYNEIKKTHGRDSDAAADNSKGQNLPNWPLESLSSDQYHILMYNTGITLLRCGQFQQAFDCLLEAVQLFSRNPRLWYRLAECCVMVHKQSVEEDCQLSKRQEVVERAIGSGVHRKLIFGCGVAKDHANCTTMESGAMPMATMEFASLCLDNALLCLDCPTTISFDLSSSTNNTSSKQDSSEAKTHQTTPVFIQAPPGNPLTSEEVASLRCSVLALQAYVSLYHQDHLVVLSIVEELLRQPRLSGVHRYLAHVYKADALVALDRLSDAIQNLNPDNITDISNSPSSEPTAVPGKYTERTEKNTERGASEPPEDRRVSYSWFPKDLTQARGIMVYNLAAAYATRGDYEKASSHLTKSKTLVGLPLPVQMYYLKIYLGLLQGHRKLVQQFIKDQFGHMTVNRLI